MNNAKILIVNLLILLCYLVAMNLMFDKLGMMVFSAILIAVHMVVNIALCAVEFNKNRTKAYYYLLSIFLVLLVGFPTCWYM